MKGQVIFQRTEAFKRVDRYRRAAKIPKGEFCDRLGIHRPAYAKLSRGEMFFTMDQMYQLMTEHNLDPAWIMAGRLDGLSPAMRTLIESAPEEE